MIMLLSVHATSVLFLVLVEKFRPDYGLVLELHALTLVAHSYALLYHCKGFFYFKVFLVSFENFTMTSCSLDTRISSVLP